MATKVETLDIRVNDILAKHGLENGGRVMKMFANEIIRLSDDYAPFDSGVLKNSAYFDGEYIVYDTPYARYLWYGKLMVDPYTLKGAFFNEEYGFWSRPNTKKILSNRDLNYHNNETGLRGSYWVNRMWADYGDDICEAIEKSV